MGCIASEEAPAGNPASKPERNLAGGPGGEIAISPLACELTSGSPAGSPAWADTIPFIPPVTAGFVIKVYDGDTITVAARLPYADSPLYRFPVRLRGIDSPEIRGKSPAERAAAVAARDALAARIFGRTVELRNTGSEKFGRLLADVYLTANLCAATDETSVASQSLNDWMVASGFAVKYDGGKKDEFVEP